MPDPAPPDPIREYHQRSKHCFERYAAGPGFLDWSTQPDPFRRFGGCPQLPLPLRADGWTGSYAEAFQAGRPAAALNLDHLALLLELSFGLSAWKAYEGERWALRCNPSSGNLHPTEAYVIAGSGIDGLEPGIYHYQSHDHALEQRCRTALPLSGLLVGLSSIHWREAWKYGERAFRYCQHDVGHALGALRYAAATLGWHAELLEDWGDDDLAALLGLDRLAEFPEGEREAPDLLCRIGVGTAAPSQSDGASLAAAARDGDWFGSAGALSATHRHRWDAIDQVHCAAAKPPTRPPAPLPPSPAAAPLPPPAVDHLAAGLIRQRRSAQVFDGMTALPARAFFRLLDACLPRPELPPFDCWPWPPRVHPVLFVHRVDGLTPGLYVLARHHAAAAELRSAMRSEFAWSPVDGCPSHLPLYQLVRANAQQAAMQLCCHQDIAGAGCFSLGMLAEFDAALAQGNWMYRRLFWECGLIGQCLYLEAEAAGLRGTGIGCYLDDAVHDVLGLTGTRYQSLYHFTVGAPLLDERLQTLPPYGHLQR